MPELVAYPFKAPIDPQGSNRRDNSGDYERLTKRRVAYEAIQHARVNSQTCSKTPESSRKEREFSKPAKTLLGAERSELLVHQ